MRRFIILSSLMVAVGAAGVASAGAQAPASNQPAQTSAAKKPNARAVAQSKKTAHRPDRREYKKTADKNGAKRADYRPEFTQNSVEVINGDTTRKVVFADETKPGEPSKGAPSQLKVEVMNGNSTDTRYFYVDQNAPQMQAALNEPKQPVVVGIQSSDTRYVGGNKHPVVTGITEAQPGDAKSTSAGGQKLTNGVAPQPKRPEYDPNIH